jgi:hypothetical protein
MDGPEIAALPRSTVTYDHRPWKELATAHFSGDLAPTFDVEDWPDRRRAAVDGRLPARG